MFSHLTWCSPCPLHLPHPQRLIAACFYAWQLASILAFCHERRVVHHDLKPANMLLGETCGTAVAAWATSSSSGSGGGTSSSGWWSIFGALGRLAEGLRILNLIDWGCSKLIHANGAVTRSVRGTPYWWVWLDEGVDRVRGRHRPTGSGVRPLAHLKRAKVQSGAAESC